MQQEQLYELVYKLDFIDLNILEQIIMNDYMMAFPVLIKRLEKINVWNRGIIRRRVENLKTLKVLHFEDKTSPMIIEVYKNQSKEVTLLKEGLRRRIIRY